ncbi:hypothetical protein N0V90_004402 [Kalmusia sp. IMI 367209]|nr:hypothetical protein N0V90_004402 [Kalmusia sp. IMI 367209]
MTRPQVLRVPPGNPLSPSSLQTVRSWLSICTSKHSQCGQGIPKRLPTRILDISSSTIRLHDSQAGTARYACLSHCWGPGGGSKLLKATRDTLQGLHVEIPWDRLPRTFQDAIVFARELGLSYIWIDSLCIVQDDPDDWQREAARMASIYQNAFLTLAERILSPRFLHFTSSELYWECRSHEFCECGEYSNSLIVGPKAEFASQHVRHAWDAPSPWYMLVGEFSALSMTFGRDVFPAMSGLVKAWRREEGDEYCAGLWRSSFIEGLLWRRYPKHVDGRVAERPTEWRAPSWSWAAITGAPVGYSVEGVFTKRLVDVLEVECVPKGLDPEGELMSAFAVLEGKALMGRILEKTAGSGSDLRAFIALTWDGGSYTLPLEPDVSFWDDETVSENANLDVLILMIAERPRDNMEQKEASRAFLVLQRAHNVSESWSRIAALTLDFHLFIAKEAYEMAGRDPWELVVSIRSPNNAALRKAHSTLTQRVFDEFDRQAKRPIRIV